MRRLTEHEKYRLHTDKEKIKEALQLIEFAREADVIIGEYKVDFEDETRVRRYTIKDFEGYNCFGFTRMQDYFFHYIAKTLAFSDCSGEYVHDIEWMGRKVKYVGWQPDMLYEFKDSETGETIWADYFPEWEH